MSEWAVLLLASVLALGACAWVPPHEGMPASDAAWRRSVGAMR